MGQIRLKGGAKSILNVNGSPRGISMPPNTATPEMYGAVGDGVTDDTTAIETALASGMAVVANKTYKISTVTVKDAYLQIVGTIIGTVRLSNNATVEGGTIQQTTTDPCVIVESTASGGAGYLNGTLRGVNLKPLFDGGCGIKLQTLSGKNALFGFKIENIDITSCEKAIWFYNERWTTKGDLRNIYCHSPSYAIYAENRNAGRSNLADITISNLYAQYNSGTARPVNFLRVQTYSVDLTLYDCLCYDWGASTPVYWISDDALESKITLLGRYGGYRTSSLFSNQSSQRVFWFDNTIGTTEPHSMKCAAKVNLPVDNYGSIAPEGWTGGPATRFIGLVSRGGYNFGPTIPNHVSGISWYMGRLVLLRSTDGTVASSSYIEVATPRSGAVYTTATLPSDALDGATCWCSDIKMQVTRYNNKWYKPDGTALA